MIYFDNAATTYYKPPQVIQAVTTAIQRYNFNPGRSASKDALFLSEKIAETRLAIKTLVGGYDENNVVFSQNCTTALNLAILGSARKNGHVIVTATEHNSVLRPVFELQSRKIVDVTVVSPNCDGEISPESVTEQMRENTYMVILNAVSNVTGKMQDVEAIAKAVRRKNDDVTVLVDGAQAMGYTVFDMKKQCIDMLAFPSHKGLHGIQGVGVLVFNGKKAPRSIIYGGTGTESKRLVQPTQSPEAYEAGTLNCPAIIGLYSALDWWTANYKALTDKTQNLCTLLHEGLAQIDGVRLYSRPNQSGIASFSLKDYDSTAVADYLSDKYDVATRGGLHCAPLMHKYLGTLDKGLIRVSVAVSNTQTECYKLLNVINDLSKTNLLG